MNFFFVHGNMHLYDFKTLDPITQLEIVIERGVLLLDRNEGNRGFLLYQVDNFYAEVMLELTCHEISGLKSFTSTDLLEPYLENININMEAFF